MRRTPTTSVIIPTHNHAVYLSTAIESVLAQTSADWELIIVDDGSTDDTADVVSDFIDHRIKYIQQPNQGLATARNTGLTTSRGKYVAFLDADDVFLPKKLETQANQLDRCPGIGLVAGGWYYTDVFGSVTSEATPWNWKGCDLLDIDTFLRTCPFIVNCVLVRRDWVVRLGGFDHQFRRVEDWDLWLRLAHAGCEMAWTTVPVCQYRLHSSNMTKDVVAQTKMTIAMLDKFYSTGDFPVSTMTQRGLAYARIHLRGAGQNCALGHIREAQADLLEAYSYWPRLFADDVDTALDYILEGLDYPAGRGSATSVECLFSNLPETLCTFSRYRRRIVGKLAVKRLLETSRQRNLREALIWLIRVVYYTPSSLKSRGILHAVLSQLVGDNIARAIGFLTKPRISFRGKAR